MIGAKINRGICGRETRSSSAEIPLPDGGIHGKIGSPRRLRDFRYPSAVWRSSLRERRLRRCCSAVSKDAWMGTAKSRHSEGESLTNTTEPCTASPDFLLNNPSTSSSRLTEYISSPHTFKKCTYGTSPLQITLHSFSIAMLKRQTRSDWTPSFGQKPPGKVATICHST